MFKIIQKSKNSQARIGILKTLHGAVETPFFMPVATKGAVKTVSPNELKEIGASVVLSNTFHLLVRPGLAILKKAGGLHKFMAWNGPILTDSGGYQIFSLAVNRKISDKGAEFRSDINGEKIFLGPEESLKAQRVIGSDIVMVLDECPTFSVDKKAIEIAMQRTFLWAKRSKDFFNKQWKGKKPLLFGIVQGGIYQDLRKKSVQDLLSIDFDGYAAGGLCLGESKSKTAAVVRLLGKVLPGQKPRYQMGAGFPEQIVQAVKSGFDMFDCVLPSRNARHGQLFVFNRAMHNAGLTDNFYQIVKINKSIYQGDLKPLDKGCACYACQNFSKAYLHHLYRVAEPLYQRLATLHNLTFYFELIDRIKNGIKQGKI